MVWVRAKRIRRRDWGRWVKCMVALTVGVDANEQAWRERLVLPSRQSLELDKRGFETAERKGRNEVSEKFASLVSRADNS